MFLNILQQFEVTLHEQKNLLLVLGIFLYSATLATYIGALNHSVKDGFLAEKSIWTTNIVVHIIVGVSVAVDAWCYGGKFWPLQMFIIGCASFITFTLPALLGMYLTHEDTAGVAITLTSIVLACFSNAMMLSVLFELFHRGILHKNTSKK